MSVLIVGTTALDSIETPNAENPRLLGGSASHAAVAASFFSPVKLVGGVGEDFPKKYIELYRRHKIDLTGLQVLPGKTFHWSGRLRIEHEQPPPCLTELGVIEMIFTDAARVLSKIPSLSCSETSRPRSSIACSTR